MKDQVLCHQCRTRPATFYVFTARQPIFRTPHYDNVRLGITLDQQHYLDVGQGPQHVQPLCPDCARRIPDDEKWQFA
jgi:hypothetical protein